MIKFLDLHSQYLSIKPAIDEAIQSVIRDSAFIGGPYVERFEREFGEFQQAKFCIGVGNGTDGLEIALEALNLPPGSEVIVPANSFIASAEAVTRSGHQVVFADVSPETYTLDIADVERKLSPRTKAIIAVHLYGHPCEMDELLTIANDRGLRVVEDCAQAHGAEYKGRRVGTLGHLGVFSFYPGKNLGAYGDGGAIVTNDEALARYCRMIANHGRIAKYDHEFEGRNSRLDGMQAAILSVKLRTLERWIDRRNEIAAAYLAGLKDVPGIVVPVVKPYVRHAFHLFVIQAEDRNKTIAILDRAAIQHGIHYPKALPDLNAYRHLDQTRTTPHATDLALRLLSLPIGEHISDHEVKELLAVMSAG